MIEFEAVGVAGEGRQSFLTAEGVMAVFCKNCGKPVPGGSKFCLSCGAPLPTVPSAAPPPATAAPPPPGEPQREKKGGGGFFSSPAGIALVVIIGVAVLGGIALGIVFGVRSGGSSSNGTELNRVWEEYENIANEAETAQAKITMDPTALNKAKADLATAQKKAKALQDVLAQTKVPEKQRTKYVQLKKTINVYDNYAGASVDLYGTLANAVANNTLAAEQAAINAKLEEVKGLLSDLNNLMNDFVANNDAITAKPTFEPNVAIDTIDNLGTAISDTTGTTTPTSETPAPTTPEPTTPTVPAPAETLNGTYVGGDYTITFSSDGTWSGVSTSAGSNGGTYSVSSNTVTLSSTSGESGTGEIQQDGSILLSNGTAIERQ
jgi:zinc-ribbon domain